MSTARTPAQPAAKQNTKTARVRGVNVADVCLVTCDEFPELDADESHLLGALKHRGVTVRIASWTGPRDPFIDGDLAVLRCPWDYSTNRDAFLAFVDDVAARGRLVNPAAVIHWNTDKRYLNTLARAGVTTVPTLYVAKGEPAPLKTLVEGLPQTDHYVVKPTIGAGSRDTIKFAMADLEKTQAVVDALVKNEGIMVQPFLPGIAEGEVSLVYVDGSYSHAVNKIPRDDDFRSQPEFGSRVERHEPTEAERAVADTTLAAMHHALGPVASFLLYARIDLVRGLDGNPVLIELELTEPSLYLGWGDGVADRLADAIVDRARRGRR